MEEEIANHGELSGIQSADQATNHLDVAFVVPIQDPIATLRATMEVLVSLVR